MIDLSKLTNDEQSEVHRIIERSLPNGPGMRNRQIFHLAKRLQGIPRLAGANPLCLRPIVDAWYAKAKSNISGVHDNEDCWAEFLCAWPRIKHPGEIDLAGLAREVADEPPHPACDALGFEKRHKQVLVGLCAKLQEAQGDEPFFLACRTAAEVLEVAVGEPISHKSCNTDMGALVAGGVLELVEKGDTRRASRYRFIWQPGQVTVSERPDWLGGETDTTDDAALIDNA